MVSLASGDGGDSRRGLAEAVVVDVDPSSSVVFAAGGGAWRPRAGRSPRPLPTWSRGSPSACCSAWRSPPVVTRVAAPLGGVPRGGAAMAVGGGLIVFFAAVVLLVAPPAVEQASTFSRELPATVRELYSWPVVGDRLERTDAAGRVEDADRPAAGTPRRRHARRARSAPPGRLLQRRRRDDHGARRARRRRAHRAPAPRRGAAMPDRRAPTRSAGSCTRPSAATSRARSSWPC